MNSKSYKISLITAMTKDRVIGKGLELPWHIPEDWAYFKKVTLGKPIIMGRKTFDSIKRKPLPGRDNIILSRTLSSGDGYKVVSSMEDALNVAGDVDEIMVIGGANIYKKFLPLANKMYISFVHKNYEGDIFFPEYNINEWEELSKEVKEEFTIKILQKKNS